MVDGSPGDGHQANEATSLQDDLCRLLPMELLDLFEKQRNWNRKDSQKSGGGGGGGGGISSLIREKEALGRHLYAKVHFL